MSVQSRMTFRRWGRTQAMRRCFGIWSSLIGSSLSWSALRRKVAKLFRERLDEASNPSLSANGDRSQPAEDPKSYRPKGVRERAILRRFGEIAGSVESKDHAGSRQSGDRGAHVTVRSLQVSRPQRVCAGAIGPMSRPHNPTSEAQLKSISSANRETWLPLGGGSPSFSGRRFRRRTDRGNRRVAPPSGAMALARCRLSN